MKIFGTVIFVAVLVFGAAYVGGVFDADVNVSINDNVKEEVTDLTTETLDGVKENTVEAIELLKSRLKETE